MISFDGLKRMSVVGDVLLCLRCIPSTFMSG